ncbi:MAG: S46 family peptidase [Prevotella sp.]|nr:S46 family peptidase [Prevotella sp.]
MKKLLLSLMCLCSLGARADEGMWTMYNLPTAIYEQMKQYGFELPMEQLYQSDNAVKNAVVNFGGYCSGVVVSPNGLVFTNHHCGFDAIRRHSTVEHDYMLNGFVAQSYEEELPNEDLFVSFMVEQKDVSDVILPQLQGLNADRQGEIVDSIENAWQKEVRQQDSTLRVEVKPFYEGNKYYCTTYRDFEDVRLVFTVPKSMGKYGGETDNWMWPRQTCDFSVFRIYADPKTGGPAKYSKDNTPYHPKSWAPVSLQGYKPGDFAMIMGYPGSTSRYLSSYGIQERRDAMNATMIQARGVKQDIMWRHMQSSEAVRIMYESKYAHSSNYWKNSIGMNKCIDSIGLIRQKQEFEAKIRQWQDSTGYLLPPLSPAGSSPQAGAQYLDFDRLQRFYQQRFNALRALYYWNETWGRECDEMTARARRVHNGIEVKGPEKNKKKQYIEFADNTKDWDQATDRELLAALMKNYREHVDQHYHPDLFQTVDRDFHGDFRAYVDHLYDHSMLMANGKKIMINKKSYDKDPGVLYGLSLTELRAALRADLTAVADSIAQQERLLCAAKLRMEQDLPNYSDANFTMRMTYGQVGEYSLGGRPSGYYTTARSLWEKMQKADENVEYFAEPVMHELLSAKDFGPYGDPLTGTLQLCFLSNNDITGGNSGSPIFNGKGELMGLAFDGNWDSLSSDIFFDRQLARTINVDIRFVLFMMDCWGHADRLLKEINAR